MKIRFFKNKNLNLCAFLILFEFFSGFLTYNLGFPATIKYLGDIINIYLILVGVKTIWVRNNNKKGDTYIYIENHSFYPALMIAALWILAGTVSSLFYGFSFPLWIWALRNWGRLFSFLFACKYIFDENSYLKMNNIIIRLFHINFFAVIIQFAFFGSSFNQDALNGIVGGDTSSMNIMLILCTLTIIYSGFFLNRYSLKKITIITGEAIIVAAIAELKILFVVIIFLFLFYAFLDMKRRGIKLKAKMIIPFVLFPIIILLGAAALSSIYPVFDGFLKSSNLISSMLVEHGGYAGTGINRLSVISVVNKNFLNTTSRRLFGIGFGNAEYSQINAFTSEFYRMYGIQYLYLGFSSASLYIEDGMVGLILYAGIYVYILLKNFARVTSSKITDNQMFLNSIGYGMTMLSLIFILYGNYQRTDVSYIIAFSLASLFIRNKRSEIRLGDDSREGT